MSRVKIHCKTYRAGLGVFYKLVFLLLSGITLLYIERSYSPAYARLLLWLAKFYITKLLLKLDNIVLKSEEETLSVLRSHDDAAGHLCLLHTWEHLNEIGNNLVA